MHKPPYLNRLDSEWLHHAAVNLLAGLARHSVGCAMIRMLFGTAPDSGPAIQIGRLQFKHPIMLAAGWDKQGQLVQALPHMGFSSLEVGTVTEHPQAGNPKPRQGLVTPGVVLNHLGFNSLGMTAVKTNILKQKKSDYPLGISLGKNKHCPADEAPFTYARLAAYLNECADYFVINASSPNTPGLRDLLDTTPLAAIITAIQEVTDKPLWLKLSPELDDTHLMAIVSLAQEKGIEALVISNTTNSKQIKQHYHVENYPGGLSGDVPALRTRATQMLAQVAALKTGLGLIASGGVTSPQAAQEKLDAGADMVQVMSGLRIYGPRLVRKIKQAWL